MKKNTKAHPIAGSAKTIHNVEGVYIGAVTEYDNGTFMAYFAPLLHGEFKASRAEAEAYIVEIFGEDVENLTGWKAV